MVLGNGSIKYVLTGLQSLLLNFLLLFSKELRNLHPQCTTVLNYGCTECCIDVSNERVRLYFVYDEIRF